MISRHWLLALMVALSACGARAGGDAAGAPTQVSVIGAPPTLADPDRHRLTAPQAVLLGAVAQGLVGFDAEGGIEPGLAGRWIVPEDGLDYIFRIDTAKWSDGAGVKAEQVARRLRSAIAAASANALAPVLGSIDEITAVTDQVVDIRLKGPRPRLLELLAQPELSVVANGRTGGPLHIASREKDAILLAPDDEPIAADAKTPADPARRILLRGERAALAVARFQQGRAELVLGGTLADLPIVRAAGIAPRSLRFDPVRGLFGLAFEGDQPFVASAAMRAALAMAIDRDRLVQSFAIPGWEPMTTLAPDGLDDLPAPAHPAWDQVPLANRRAIAIDAIAGWSAQHGALPVLRVALPPGAGMRQLFARIAADWRAIGVSAQSVALDRAADLRLVDEVAPAEIASWYLRWFDCARAGPCAQEADTALLRATISPDIDDRIARLAEADSALAAVTPFIPIASPPRWSLVSRALDGFRPSTRARHPLTLLRAGPR